MNFEEMGQVWREQSSGPEAELDWEALRLLARRQSRSLGWSVGLSEFGMAAILAGSACQQALDPLLDGRDYHQLIGSALFAFIAVGILVSRARRRRAEGRFPHSLRGDLDRSLFRLDCMLQRVRAFFWWLLLPSLLIVAISFHHTGQRKSLDDWVLALGSLLLSFAVVQLSMRFGLLPARHKIAAQRAKLLEEG